MKFQKGDQYVHYTKYGGINKGEVKEIHKIICYDMEGKVAYTEYKIVTTNNVPLSLHGEDGKIFKVVENLDDKAIERLSRMCVVARDIKERKRADRGTDSSPSKK